MSQKDNNKRLTDYKKKLIKSNPEGHNKNQLVKYLQSKQVAGSSKLNKSELVEMVKNSNLTKAQLITRGRKKQIEGIEKKKMNKDEILKIYKNNIMKVKYDKDEMKKVLLKYQNNEYEGMTEYKMKDFSGLKQWRIINAKPGAGTIETMYNSLITFLDHNKKLTFRVFKLYVCKIDNLGIIDPAYRFISIKTSEIDFSSLEDFKESIENHESNEEGNPVGSDIVNTQNEIIDYSTYDVLMEQTRNINDKKSKPS